MTTWAIVPVKPLNRAKSRLAPVLSPEVREQLAMTMLRHTLLILRESQDVSAVLVVSRDPRALVVAREYGAKTVQESGAPELNLALQRASQVIASWHAQAALILPADIPLLSIADLREMAQLGRYNNSIVITPDRMENGTNGLLLRPPGIFSCSFGSGSFDRHVAAAESAGATTHIFRSERMMLDLDTPDDLLRYLDLCKKYDVEPIADFGSEALLSFE